MKDESDTTVLLDYTQAGGWNVLPDFAPTTITDAEGVREMSDTALRFQPTTVGNMVVDAKGGYVSYEELAAAIAQRDKAVADADHFFVLSGQYLARANDAEAQRDKEIQKRKEISEATVKLFKYLRPYLTEECQKLVDEADAAVKEF
jgi:hypothetical protein